LPLRTLKFSGNPGAPSGPRSLLAVRQQLRPGHKDTAVDIGHQSGRQQLAKFQLLGRLRVSASLPTND
jgi:hypothetical protein